MTDSVHRLFVAVPLSAEIKEALSASCVRLREELAFRKWTHPDDLHITLQFLGDTPTSKRGDVVDVLREAAGSSAPFELTVEGFGVFGRPIAPSIFWAGVGGELEPLAQLQRQISAALVPLGYEPEERRFHPHITLARSYTEAARFSREQLAKLPPPRTADGRTLRWTAGEITLYESHLQRKPMYEAVARIPLSAARPVGLR